MNSESKVLSDLVVKCENLLEEVCRITEVINSNTKNQKIEEIESLFVSRGEEIQKLTDMENELIELLDKSRIYTESEIVKDYNSRRTDIFQKIQVLDKEVNQIILKVKNEVLQELKELQKGRKMQQEYLGNSNLPSSFVDIKE